MHIIRRSLQAVLLCMVCVFYAPAGAVVSAWQRIELGAIANRYPFAIYSNKPWHADMGGIRSTVIVFHGVSRNGAGYYAAAEKLLEASGGSIDETLVIAPSFFTPGDTNKHALEGMPLWSERSWGAGRNATNWPLPLSSFQVVDDLLHALADRTRFPRLERITIAGHSAGGQLVHRYAALNQIDESLRASGIRVRYVVANPSSYLYFTSERPNGTAFTTYDESSCQGYNRYRYGIENLLPYGAGAADTNLFRRYAARDTTYLLGTRDHDPDHRLLDKSCGARAQGSNRLERGHNYVRYEQHLAGSQIRLEHRACEVVGVGHQQSRMFGSKCGAFLLFGMPPEKNTAGAACRVPELSKGG